MIDLPDAKVTKEFPYNINDRYVTENLKEGDWNFFPPYGSHVHYEGNRFPMGEVVMIVKNGHFIAWKYLIKD